MPIYILNAAFKSCKCSQKDLCEHPEYTFYPVITCENSSALPKKVAELYSSWGIYDFEIVSESNPVEIEQDDTCPMPSIEELHQNYKNQVQIATHCPFDSIELERDGIGNFEALIEGPKEVLALSWKARSQSMERQEARWRRNPELWVRIPKTPAP